MQFKMASDDDCNICFERIPPDDNKGKGQGCPNNNPKCNKKFCSKCIDTWLEINPKCPQCTLSETSANKEKREERKLKHAVEAEVAAELKRKLKIGATAATTLAAIIVGGYASPQLLLGLSAMTTGAISLYPKPFRDLWYNHFASPESRNLTDYFASHQLQYRTGS